MSSYSMHSQKRMKHANRLPVLTTTSHGNYDSSYTQQSAQAPFTYAPQNHLAVWGRGEQMVSPYPQQDMWTGDYSRSPFPGAESESSRSSFHSSNHLAPLMHSAGSAVPSPTLGQGSNFGHQTQLHTQHLGSQHQAQQIPQQQANQAAYYPRSAAGQTYMQQQQLDYLQQHTPDTQFNYGAPFLTDSSWENTYTGSAI